jgi:hypothetical protein
MKRYRRSLPSLKDVAPTLNVRYPGHHFSVWSRRRESCSNLDPMINRSGFVTIYQWLG